MDWLKKLENIKKFYQDPGFVYPEARPTEPKSVQYQEYLKMEPYLEPSSQMFVRDEMGFDDGGLARKRGGNLSAKNLKKQ